MWSLLILTINNWALGGKIIKSAGLLLVTSFFDDVTSQSSTEFQNPPVVSCVDNSRPVGCVGSSAADPYF